MAWKELVLVTGRSSAHPCQVRISCDSTDEEHAQGILDDLKNHLDNYYGNYSGEEYDAILQMPENLRKQREARAMQNQFGQQNK